MTIDEHRERAEKQIQKILIDLEEDTGQRLDMVEVDTRMFANCRVEIFFDRADQ